MPTEWWLTGTCEECPAGELEDGFAINCCLEPLRDLFEKSHFCVLGRRLMAEIRAEKAKAEMDTHIKDQMEKLR